MSEPRSMTPDECRDEFLGYLRLLVMDTAREDRAETVVDKLNLLVFSILNVFDGTACGCRPFSLVTRSHPADEEWYKSEGANWWPQGVEIESELHGLWARQFQVKE